MLRPSALAAVFVTGLAFLPVLACDPVDLGSNEGDTSQAQAGRDGGAGACGSRGLAPCATGLDCIFPVSAACGAADRPGTCAVRPAACPANVDPVCGCDGKTYGNECSAHAAGVSVQSAGACPVTGPTDGGADVLLEPGRMCGARGFAPCRAGEFCAFSVDADCGMLDAPGHCEAMPTACPPNVLAVCGCDNQTYLNECGANAIGVSVKHQGRCN